MGYLGKNTQKTHTLHFVRCIVYYEKLTRYFCFNSVQGTPLPPPKKKTKLTTKAAIKDVEINIVRREGEEEGEEEGGGGGGGGDCIVKRMRNFARAIAKVSQDVWPGLYSRYKEIKN